MEYTGIGSRETPHQICQIMTIIAQKLDAFGLTLRSGGADGADTAFENGSTKKKIFLPWENFNDRNGIVLSNEDHEKAGFIRRTVIGHSMNMSFGAKKLHNRNVCQVLDLNFDNPTDFVICWTKGGKTVGGTATAMKLARKFTIPIFNLAIKNDLEILMSVSTLAELKNVVYMKIAEQYGVEKAESQCKGDDFYEDF